MEVNNAHNAEKVSTFRTQEQREGEKSKRDNDKYAPGTLIAIEGDVLCFDIGEVLEREGTNRDQNLDTVLVRRYAPLPPRRGTQWLSSPLGNLYEARYIPRSKGKYLTSVVHKNMILTAFPALRDDSTLHESTKDNIKQALLYEDHGCDI